MFSRKIQIFIVLGAILITAIIIPSKIEEMLLLGGSEAEDIYLDLLATAASLFTLLAAIDIKESISVYNCGKAINESKQPDVALQLKNSNPYYRFNIEVKQVLKNLPKYLVNHIIVTILLFVAIIVLLIIHFNNIACYFYGATEDANGQLLKVLLTAIGGGAVIYGLYLNSKRIKEQTIQNDIAKKQAAAVVDNNNDKRFGDAIGYLGSDNVNIALGGVYTLHQLAKEDSRYIPLVNNLYSGYLKDKSIQFYTDDRYKFKPPVIIQAIIDIYFNENSVFKDEQIDLSDTTLINIHFNGCVRNSLFKRGILKNCFLIYGMKNCDFLQTDINHCRFAGRINSCQFNFLNISETFFGNSSEECVLENCKFILNEINCLIFVCNSMSQIEFYSLKTMKCEFIVNSINNCFFSFIGEEDVKFCNAKFTESSIDTYNGNSICFENCQNNPIV